MHNVIPAHPLPLCQCPPVLPFFFNSGPEISEVCNSQISPSRLRELAKILHVSQKHFMSLLCVSLHGYGHLRSDSSDSCNSDGVTVYMFLPPFSTIHASHWSPPT